MLHTIIVSKLKGFWQEASQWPSGSHMHARILRQPNFIAKKKNNQQASQVDQWWSLGRDEKLLVGISLVTLRQRRGGA